MRIRYSREITLLVDNLKNYKSSHFRQKIPIYFSFYPIGKAFLQIAKIKGILKFRPDARIVRIRSATNVSAIKPSSRISHRNPFRSATIATPRLKRLRGNRKPAEAILMHRSSFINFEFENLEMVAKNEEL